MSYLDYPIKCSACGLHYTVHSWNEEWLQENGGGHCPECGVQGAKMIWSGETREGHIFEVVPGNAQLAGITERRT